MPAMTMPYDVEDPKEYEGVTLATSSRRPSSSEPTKSVSAAGEEGRHCSARGCRRRECSRAAAGFELIKMGAPVPNQTFVNQDGKSVSLADFRGDAVIVTSHVPECPMPTMCPDDGPALREDSGEAEGAEQPAQGAPAQRELRSAG